MAMPARRLPPEGPSDPDLVARVRQWIASLGAEDLRWASEELAAASAVLSRAAEPGAAARRDADRRLDQAQTARPGVPLGLFGPGDEDRVASLAAREAELAARARSLHEAEQRLSQARQELVAAHRNPAPPMASALPAAAAAAQLHALMVDTGDDVATVARGVGVEPTWAAGVLSGEITTVDIAHVQALCEGLHCTPYDLFGAEAARSIDHAYGPELWPRYIEPLGAVGPAVPTAVPERSPAAPSAAVPAASVAFELRSALVGTGRDVEDLATDFGIDGDWIRGVLRGEIASVDAGEFARLVEGLDRPVGGVGEALDLDDGVDLFDTPEYGPGL